MADKLDKRAKLDAAIMRAIDKWCSEPFQWGRNDCLLSLADIIKDALGYDPAADFRNRYTTRRGAARVAKAHGGFRGALKRAARRHGWRPISPAQAKTGDVGAVSDRVFVIRHGGFWLQRTEQPGFRAVTDAVFAWRI